MNEIQERLDDLTMTLLSYVGKDHKQTVKDLLAEIVALETTIMTDEI